MKTSFWFLIIIIIFVVIFSVQNADAVLVRFAVWEGNISLAILMISTFLLGLIFGAVYSYFGLRKQKKVRDIGDIAFESETEGTATESEEINQER